MPRRKSSQKELVLTEEDKKFYAGFVTRVDTISVDIQLSQIKEIAYRLVRTRNGDIIPRQTTAELQELFAEAVDLYARGLRK